MSLDPGPFYGVPQSQVLSRWLVPGSSSFPSQDWGKPPPGQTSRASTCYAAGGMPLAFTVLLPPAYVVRREGNSFTLFVCPHLGGVPISHNALQHFPECHGAAGGYPGRGGTLPGPARGGTLAGGYPGWGGTRARGVPWRGGTLPGPAGGVPWLGGYPVRTT